jgi:hypothetical protein
MPCVSLQCERCAAEQKRVPLARAYWQLAPKQGKVRLTDPALFEHLQQAVPKIVSVFSQRANLFRLKHKSVLDDREIGMPIGAEELGSQCMAHWMGDKRPTFRETVSSRAPKETSIASPNAHAAHGRPR